MFCHKQVGPQCRYVCAGRVKVTRSARYPSAGRVEVTRPASYPSAGRVEVTRPASYPSAGRVEVTRPASYPSAGRVEVTRPASYPSAGRVEVTRPACYLRATICDAGSSLSPISENRLDSSRLPWTSSTWTRTGASLRTSTCNKPIKRTPRQQSQKLIAQQSSDYQHQRLV